MQSGLSETPGIVSVPPSQRFEGADGSWSTFEIQVGTPPQSVRLLPGTSASAANQVLVVIDEGCTVLNTAISGCATKRGELFKRNDSSTWSVERLTNNGLFSIPMVAEKDLNLLGNDNAYYGFDSVKLGSNESTAMSGQLVGGMATNDLYLGVLGLSPLPANFTSFNDPIPSLLGSMRIQRIVNSTSWAYTAGKSYTKPPVYGSLTFGGYDASRSSGSSLKVPFDQDNTRELIVGLQSIISDGYGSTPLLSQGVYIFLNSLVAQMWLPLVVCDQFEKQFNLTWNDDLKYYFISESAHSSLMAQNPTFTFTLGMTPARNSGDSTIDIKIPYAAFNLNLSAPYVNSTDRYFPLRRAQNVSQYTLGRVFFQEAYIVADYDKQVLSVSQARSVNASTSTQLVTLNPSLAANTSSPLESLAASNIPRATGLPVGAITGIAVGGVVLLALLAGLVIWLLRRKRRRGLEMIQQSHRASKELPADMAKGISMHTKFQLDERETGLHELRAEYPELHSGAGVSYAHEMPTVEKAAELSVVTREVWELPADSKK